MDSGLCPDRQFIQDPSQLVREWSLGQLYLQPGLQLDEQFSVLYKCNLVKEDRVTVISGGGSGHEPAHSGYIGTGMLDAAVSGSIFASPNVRQIYRMLEHAASAKGTLMIVKNYTGDKLNFGLAAERYKASTGNNVKIVLVADDVSVGRSRGTFVGRRGLAGTVLVHKIAGAAAERGLELEEITSLCSFVSENMGTIGVSLGPCNVPGQKALERPQPWIELGMGIHNEPAIVKLHPDTMTDAVIEKMLHTLLDAENKEHGYLPNDTGQEGNSVVLLMNNLGGLSVIEIGALTSMVTAQLKTRYNIVPCRTYAGTFLTALDGRGFSITLVNLNKSTEATAILSLLDDQTTANGWSGSIPASDWMLSSELREAKYAPTGNTTARSGKTVKGVSCEQYPSILATTTSLRARRINDATGDGTVFSKIIRSIWQEIMTAEPEITRYDMICGDGDCGTTLLSGANAMMDAMENGSIPVSNISKGMEILAEIVTDAMGGTSGAIYGIFLSAFAAAIIQDDEESISMRMMARASSKALCTLKQFTGARNGNRTLMDTSIPFVDELQKSVNSNEGIAALEDAVEQAIIGCETTRFLTVRFGRSTYVSDEHNGHLKDGSPPDPGACGVVAVLTGIVKGMNN